MLIIPPLPSRYRKHAAPAATKPPAATLTLVAAAYDGDSLGFVTLTFDRAVDLASVDPSAITVNDNEFTGKLYAGQPGGATLVGPAVVRVALQAVGEPGPGLTLSATAANGIVAADDGAAWAGVSAVVLPFP